MMKQAPPKQDLPGDDSTDKLITEIRANDVLLGRGAGPNEHTGNITFRVIVAKQKAVYMATTNRQEKNKIAIKTIQIVRAQKGRFLQKVKDRDDDVYEIADDKVVLEKTKQALRHLNRASRSKADTQKGQATKKPSRPLHQGVGGPLNAFFFQDASIAAHRRSAAFPLREDFSDLPIVSSRSSYSQFSARDINAAAASLGIQAEIPNRSGLPTSTIVDNLRHLEFQEQLNSAYTTLHQGREEQEKKAVANAIALMNARNSADNPMLASILKEYGGLSTIGTSGPGINPLLSSVSSPFQAQRGLFTRGSTTDSVPSALDELARLLGASRGNPGSSRGKYLEQMLNISGGTGPQSSYLQSTASNYLGNHKRGLQQGDQDQAAVAALRDNTARVTEVLALLDKNPLDANACDRV
jgi:hypothetical protein